MNSWKTLLGDFYHVDNTFAGRRGVFRHFFRPRFPLACLYSCVSIGDFPWTLISVFTYWSELSFTSLTLWFLFQDVVSTLLCFLLQMDEDSCFNLVSIHHTITIILFCLGKGLRLWDNHLLFITTSPPNDRHTSHMEIKIVRPFQKGSYLTNSD